MKHKKRLLYALGGLLLGWLIVRSDVTELLNLLSTLTYWHIAVLMTLQIITILLIALQWRIIARHMSINTSYRLLVSMNMAGTFIESVTPAVKSGGETAKVLFLKHHGLQASRASALVITQKVLSFLFFVLVLIASLTLFSVVNGDHIAQLQNMVTWAIMVMVSIIGVLAVIFVIAQKSTRQGRIIQFFKDIGASLSPLKQQRPLYLLHALLGILIWGLYAFKVVVLLIIMNVDVSLIFAPIATYSAYIVGMVPITPGGLGTFETTFTQIIGLGGVSITTALSVVLTLRIVTFWFSLLLSTLWFMIYKKRGTVYA